jgi:bifunctional non-homologous end joining protein LigD
MPRTRAAHSSPFSKGPSFACGLDDLPTWIKPQLATLLKEAPDGPDWLHEIKLDGYRMHARLNAGRVQILTRRGNDWTDKYPPIATAIARLPARNAYLDGELCGVLPDGRTAFNLIQNASDTGQGALVLFLFDLLFLEPQCVCGFRQRGKVFDGNPRHAGLMRVAATTRVSRT